MGQAEVQGNASRVWTIKPELLVSPLTGAEISMGIAYGPPVDEALEVVPLSVAEALAAALDGIRTATMLEAIPAAHRNALEALHQYRKAHPKRPLQCPRCNGTGWCCHDQPDPHRCRCGIEPADQRKEGTGA